MNISGGFRRVKILWAYLCIIPAGAIIFTLLLSEYRPDLMRQFSSLILLIAAALTIPPFLNATIKSRLLIAVLIGSAAAATMFNLDKNQHPFYGDAKPILLALATFTVWLIWSGIEWVTKGFQDSPGGGQSSEVPHHRKSGPELELTGFQRFLIGALLYGLFLNIAASLLLPEKLTRVVYAVPLAGYILVSMLAGFARESMRSKSTNMK